MIKIVRRPFTQTETFGDLYIDGEFYCHTLEDTYHEVKIPGHTRIPSGRYRVCLRTEGTFHEKYRTRFWHMHRGMLWLQNVPEFKWILIHPGNSHRDTQGCILPGMEIDGSRLVHSTKAYELIYPIIVHKIRIEASQTAALLIGDEFELEQLEAA